MKRYENEQRADRNRRPFSHGPAPATVSSLELSQWVHAMKHDSAHSASAGRRACELAHGLHPERTTSWVSSGFGSRLRAEFSCDGSPRRTVELTARAMHLGDREEANMSRRIDIVRIRSRLVGAFGILLLSAVGAVTACSSNTANQRADTPSSARGNSERGSMVEASCPMSVAGTTASVEDTDGGVAVAFKTRSGDVSELRRRVKQMAEVHNRYHAENGGHSIGGCRDQGTSADSRHEQMMGDCGPDGSSPDSHHGQMMSDSHGMGMSGMGESHGMGMSNETGESHGMGMSHGMGESHGMGMSHDMIPSTARTEDVEGGARIVMTPKNASDLAALRQHVRDHAARMANGECPMMMMGQRSSKWRPRERTAVARIRRNPAAPRLGSLHVFSGCALGRLDAKLGRPVFSIRHQIRSNSYATIALKVSRSLASPKP